MNSNDRFEQYEDASEKRTLEILNKEFRHLTVKRSRPKSRWDYEIYNSAGRLLAVVELKSRNIDIREYKTAILTDDKYEALMKVATEKNVKAYYLAEYLNGHYAIWNLTDGSVHPTTSVKYAPKYTAVTRGSKSKVAWEFPFTEAKVIR